MAAGISSRFSAVSSRLVSLSFVFAFNTSTLIVYGAFEPRISPYKYAFAPTFSATLCAGTANEASPLAALI